MTIVKRSEFALLSTWVDAVFALVESGFGVGSAMFLLHAGDRTIVNTFSSQDLLDLPINEASIVILRTEILIRIIELSTRALKLSSSTQTKTSDLTN